MTLRAEKPTRPATIRTPSARRCQDSNGKLAPELTKTASAQARATTRATAKASCARVHARHSASFAEAGWAKCPRGPPPDRASCNGLGDPAEISPPPAIL